MKASSQLKLKSPLLIMGLFFPLLSQAADTSELDAALEGFEQTQFSNIQPFATIPEPVSKWQFAGKLTTQAAFAYQTSEQEWKQASLRGDIGIDYRDSDWKFKFNSHAVYDGLQNELDSYESEFEIDETYIQGKLNDNVDLSFGRQIKVWGKSDNIRVTDVINPLDNRTPGLTDIEYLRLPILMTQANYFWQDWTFSLMAIHEQRPSKVAPENSDFLPTTEMLGHPVTLPELSDQSDWKTTPAFSAEGRFSGWDISLYTAEVQQSQWTLDASKNERKYELTPMQGLAGNYVLDDWLIKAEVAHFNEVHYSNSSKSFERWDSMLGAEYLNLPNWSFSFEVANRHIVNYSESLASFPDLVTEDSWQTALRVSYDFNHERGKVSYLLSMNGLHWEEGGFQRMWLEYDINDSNNIIVGVIDYISGEHPYWQAIRNNDRLFAEYQLYF